MSGEGGMLDRPEQIELLRWSTVRSALKLEIGSKMIRSNRGRSTLTLANEITGRNDRRKEEAYKHLNAKIVEAGGTDRPLRQK